MKNFKFKAIPSGDYEAFTFAVSKDDFVKIRNKQICVHDVNDFLDNRYNIYPNDFFDLLDTNSKEFEIEINIKEI